MRIRVIGKRMDVSKSMQERVEKKLGKLDRYFKPDTEAVVVMSTERNRKIMEVTIRFGSNMLRAEEASDDMYTSLDQVLSKLERQMRKHRTKLEKRLKANAFEPVADEAEEPIEESLEADSVVRVKRFPIKPMTVEEAVMQMDMLGHTFHVFYNADTKQVNVLYARESGDYGLLEPEYD